MAETAATAFGVLPELLGLLAHQVRSRKQLAKLRLVSRAFAAAVSPVLFSDVQIGGTGGIRSLYNLANCEYLGFVRRLTVEDCISSDDHHEFVRQGLLPKMPRLESFTWCYMPLPSATLRVLYESCPRIKAIHVTFPYEMGRNELGYLEDDAPEPEHLRARELYGRPDFTVFSGLEELTLHALYEELPWWRAQLVLVLRRNTQSLRRLALSLSVSTCDNYDTIAKRDIFDDFFERLCDEYAEADNTLPTTTAAPLQLRSLELGTGVYAFELSWLRKLTDLRHLREVHVENNGMYYFNDVTVMYWLGEYDSSSGIAFHAFGPTYCPHLRRFTAAIYGYDVRELLAAGADDPSWARQLAVSCEMMGGDFELAGLLRGADGPGRQSSRPLHLRMLDIDLEREQVYLVDDEGDELDADKVPSAEQVLADLVAGDEGALEGLVVRIKEEPNAEGGFQHLGILAASLAQLTNLSQLVVQGISGRKLAQGRLEERLADAARLLAAAAPTLRYVKVNETCWRVWRDGTETPDGRGGAVRLEVLEDQEITDVELFRHTIWVPDYLK